MIDDTLGIAGRAGGVVESNGIPFVVRAPPGKARIAAGHEIVVLDAAQPVAALRKFPVVVVDDERLHLCQRQGGLHHRCELAIGDEDFRLGMVELKGNDRSIEPRVDGVQNGTRHRHAVVRLQHRRRIGQHHRDRVAGADAPRGKGRRQPAGARIELGIVSPQPAVNDRRAIGIDEGRALEEAQRGERLIVGRCPFQALRVGMGGHFHGPRLAATLATYWKGPRASTRPCLLHARSQQCGQQSKSGATRYASRPQESRT